MDGKGYPDGLGGDELNLLTKIITVADSYDAMTSKRIYKQNLETKQAIAELHRCAGSQFDPEVVRVFAEVLESNGEMGVRQSSPLIAAVTK